MGLEKGQARPAGGWLVRRVIIVEETSPVDARYLRELGIEMERGVALAPHTTIKIGGPADFFAIVTSIDQLQALVLWAQHVELPYFVLGGGSNMLISDAGIRGLVILNRCRNVRFSPAGPPEAEEGVILHAESGSAMAGVARQSIRRGLAGLEWAVSLPGTVGGAVVGNAGAYGGEVKDNLIDATVVSASGNIAALSVNELEYGYRSSSLKRQRLLEAGFKPVILRARFRLIADDDGAVRSRADEYLSHRRATQPKEPSLGSTFVNPPGDHAGRLIEAAGLKGTRVGGVMVSDRHANFIVNAGGVGQATASDVMRLVEVIQAEVRRAFGIDLVPEVQLAGEW